MVRLAIAVALLGIGCATAARPVDVETVGQLSRSETHVATAPVHATTDLTPGGFVAAAGDDDTSSFSTSTEAPKEEVTPDVAPKTGLVMGAAR